MPSFESTDQATLCVVVSHYSARPIDDLVRLLRQLRSLPQQTTHFRVFVKVVVNAVQVPAAPLALPVDLQDQLIEYRENTGFNMGSWDHGWRHDPGHRHYLFLQDECVVCDPAALSAYWHLLEQDPSTLVGESLQFWRGWAPFARQLPDPFRAIQALCDQRGLGRGLTATHLQTLAVAASGQALALMDGFLLANEKMEAVATEVMWSRKALGLGLGIRQSAATPFRYFEHEQWLGIKKRGSTLRWQISRGVWMLQYGWRDIGSQGAAALFGRRN